MKLIIDVPKDTYQFVKDLAYIGGVRSCKTIQANVINAIKQGRILEEESSDIWEDYDNTFYRCPECGYLLEKDCPNCHTKIILPKLGSNE